MAFYDSTVDELSIAAIDPALFAGGKEEVASYDSSGGDKVPCEDVGTKMHVVVTVHAPGCHAIKTLKFVELGSDQVTEGVGQRRVG